MLRSCAVVAPNTKMPHFLFNTWLGGFLCGVVVLVAVIIKAAQAISDAYDAGYASAKRLAMHGVKWDT